MNDFESKRQDLLDLSHELGADHRQLAILGEGNTSAKLETGNFLVKASGSSLGTLKSADLVECRSEGFLRLLESPHSSDEEIEAVLIGSQVDPQAKRPSVEALFHAYLLSLPNINFVGHTHPISVNSILCSGFAETFATRRLFPDEIVCCGGSSVLVPYTDPGLKLAQTIRDRTLEFLEKTAGPPPRVILLQNHGIITLGASAAAVKAAMFMAVKAAQIFLGAAALGGPVFLSDSDIDRITHRKDEHHRQKALNL